MDKAYYDVDGHLVNDFYQVVLVQLSIFYLNEYHNQSNHRLSKTKKEIFDLKIERIFFYTCKQ